jgi:hypothetical protein
MFCAACLSVKRAAMRNVEAPEAEASPPAAGAKCEECGRVLDGDTGQRLAAKVSQLARFGLAGRPLLSRRRV